MYIYRSASCEVPLLLSDFNETWNFSRVSKNTQIPNLVKICPVGAEVLFRAEGRTDIHDEADSRFSQFCERA